LDFRSFPLSSEFSEDFPELSRKFPEVFPVKNEKRSDHGGDRTHVLRITDLILYLPATAAIWKISVWKK
jgi:hypothetical protein